jgi:TolA-binding protein
MTIGPQSTKPLIDYFPVNINKTIESNNSGVSCLDPNTNNKKGSEAISLAIKSLQDKIVSLQRESNEKDVTLQELQTLLATKEQQTHRLRIKVKACI